MNLTIRHASFPDDYAGIARVLTAENPQWPTTPEALVYADIVRDPQFHWAVFVAEDTSSEIHSRSILHCRAWEHIRRLLKLDTIG